MILGTLFRLLFPKKYIKTLPSPPDNRDHTHYDKPEAATTVNYDTWVGFIENQADKPRCVAQGCEVKARVETNKKRDIDRDSPFHLADFDAQLFYQLCKQHDGIPNAQGTYLRIGMKLLKSHGMVENSPHGGEIYTINEYWKCKNREEVVNDLLTIGPVCLVIKIFPSFWGCTGVLQKPKSWEKMSGLHAVCATRRLDGAIGFVNSHGIKSGDHGRFILTDDLYDTYVTEAWCCK